MLISNNRIVAACFCLLFCLSGASHAQEEGYYFPIRPGEQNFLSGSAGELRSTHFHGGIDIKTGGVEGLPVYAAQEGYISRIKVSGSGYGNVIYIAHPKLGTTTVYGHLQQFKDPMAQFVKEEQYRRKRFEVELFPSKTQFIVKKGDVVALSGNSGSSGGPHLHFEIRDQYQRPLNPLKYNFSEIHDNIPPTIEKIALKTLNKGSRIDGQFGIFTYTPYLDGNTYRISTPIEVYGDIGIMVLAHDKLNGASNKNGLSSLSLEIDGNQRLAVEIDQIPFSQTREILAYRDNEMQEVYNQSFQKLYIDDGNDLKIYEGDIGGGVFSVHDETSHEARIILDDAYGNSAEVLFQLQGRIPNKDTMLITSRFKPTQYRILDNTLVFMSKSEDQSSATATVIANRIAYRIRPDYAINQQEVYLWDLRKGLPDSIVFENETLKPQIDMMVPSERSFSFFQRYMDLYFGAKSLFDTAYLKTEYLPELDPEREYFEIGTDMYPLNKSVRVILKPIRTYGNPRKTSVYGTGDFKSFVYYGGTWQGNHIEFNTRNFGMFTLLTDSIPPAIRVIEQNQERFRCYISDDLSGINDFELNIDGKWVLLNYDPKRKYCWTDKLDRSKPFKGELELKVTDNVNNVGVYMSNIN